jgi:hypothetical protein
MGPAVVGRLVSKVHEAIVAPRTEALETSSASNEIRATLRNIGVTSALKCKAL